MHTHYMVLVYMEAQMNIFINWDTYMRQCVCMCVCVCVRACVCVRMEKDGRDQDIDNTLSIPKTIRHWHPSIWCSIQVSIYCRPVKCYIHTRLSLTTWDWWALSYWHWVVWLARLFNLIIGCLGLGRDGLAVVTISSHIFDQSDALGRNFC